MQLCNRQWEIENLANRKSFESSMRLQEKGVTATIEKHGICPASCYSWKKKYEARGEEWGRHEKVPARFVGGRYMSKVADYILLIMDAFG